MTETILITKLGGSEWKKGNHHRIYINNPGKLLGLQADYYRHGGVASATLNGEKISNREAGKILTSKLWYDVNDKKYYATGEYAHELLAAVTKKVATLRAAEPAPATENVNQVDCSCGCRVPRALVMSTSTGTSCPDCYDRMSD